MNRRTPIIVSLAALALCTCTVRAQVVINEFQYDDLPNPDDREFVELYNSGLSSVDIGNWVLGGRDVGAIHPSVTIPAGTLLAPGAYYVIGQSGVPNVNLVSSVLLEDSNETLELTDSIGTLIDAVFYEGNKGPIPLTPELTAQIGSPYWGNHQGVEIGSFQTQTTVGRHIDGRDTNNNGRDFGLRPSTPGTSNHAAGIVTSYSPPNVDVIADGIVVAGTSGSFVQPRVFTPGVVTPGLNLNAIPAPVGRSKAITAWDNAGGGNGSVNNTVFGNGGSFAMQVYLDTVDLPVSTGASGPFRGAEETFFGIGSIDAFTNLANLSGTVAATGASTGANGATGIHWYYEKVGETSPGFADVSEILYLIDANDGGDSNVNSGNPLDWIIIAMIDLSNSPSGWHNLSLSIAPNGQGVAMYDNQTFNFTTMAGLVGEFSVGYRENTGNETTGTPSYLRPPTFAEIPEPGTFGLLGVAGTLLGLRHRRHAGA
jgi:Lamin Tail Domain